MDAVSELASKLAEHKSQLASIEQLLLTKPQDEILTKLRDDLRQVIALTEDLTKTKVNKIAQEQARQDGKLPKQGERVMAKYSDGKYYIARVESVVPSTKTLLVRYLDYGDALEVHADALKPFKAITPEQLAIGASIRAIFAGDGLFYDAKIDGIADQNQYIVTFTQYGDQATVPIQDIQLIKNSKKRSLDEAQSTDLPAEPVIPDNLKFKDTDTAEERESKKRRVRAIKNKHRIALLDQEQNKKKQSWQSFQSGVMSKSKKKPVPGVKQASIFRSPDDISGKVGVTNSGHRATDPASFARQSLIGLKHAAAQAAEDDE